MQNKPQSTLAAVLAATLIALASGSAAAIDVGDRIEVHGFGDLGHEVANANATGRGLGDRETGHNLSLVGVWQATDRLKAWAQLFQSSELGKVRVDWAFLDYQTASGQTLRFGRVRLPFGLHNESRDVQALRPSASLPYLYDEEMAFVDESFDGGSVEHKFDLGNRVPPASVHEFA